MTDATRRAAAAVEAAKLSLRTEPMTDAPTPMREALIATIIETLADEHPSMTQVALARWHLPGGVTPRSSGTTIDIHGLADAIDALYRDQVERLKGELAEAQDDRDDFRDRLHDLVMIDSEAWAIGGGPGFRERHDKAWSRAREPFEP